MSQTVDAITAPVWQQLLFLLQREEVELDCFLLSGILDAHELMTSLRQPLWKSLNAIDLTMKARYLHLHEK
jgi:hypothetical protein